MILSYTGSAGAAITVNEGVVTDNGDGTYTITPASGKTKLGANTKIYVSGTLSTTIHTSCSRPLAVNDVFGSFTVVGLDKIADGKAIVTDNGDGTYTITPAPGETKLEANTKIYIDGTLHTTIHTSCSKPLNVGDVFGDFTVSGIVKISDSNPQSKCKGITSLKLLYLDSTPATITVDKGVITDNGDGTYTLTPESGKDKLDSNTKFYVDDALDTIIHTSCSRPLNVNDTYGSFKIVGMDRIYENKKPQKYIDELNAINGSLYIFEMAIIKLTQIDAILARTAASEAENATVVYPQHQKKVDRELAKVQKEFEKALKDLNKCRNDKAIHHYRKAWEHSQHAIKYANKIPKPKK